MIGKKFQSTDMQIFYVVYSVWQLTGVEGHWCQCIGVALHPYGSVLVWQCTGMVVHQCPTTPVWQHTGVEGHW